MRRCALIISPIVLPEASTAKNFFALGNGTLELAGIPFSEPVACLCQDGSVIFVGYVCMRSPCGFEKTSTTF